MHILTVKEVQEFQKCPKRMKKVFWKTSSFKQDNYRGNSISSEIIFNIKALRVSISLK